MKRPIGIDLFAGAGGMSLGFSDAGFDVAAAVEFDPIHCATHEFNFPDCAAICADVSAVSADRIRSISRIGDDPVAVVFGGAPCQGFSMIGKRALDDPRNKLVFHFLRLVKELKADYFVFENVKGLTIGEHKRFLEELIEGFESAGYDVLLPYRVLNATSFGVPQDRRRLFLIGARAGLSLPEYPTETHDPGGLVRKKTPTVWDAIGDLPEAENHPELLERDWTEAEYGEPSEYASSLRNVNGKQNLLTASWRAIHTPESRERFLKTEHGDTEPISRFRKLDPAGFSNTLRAGSASDKGAFTSPRPIHPFTPRCITVREAARLHSYPDWFRFHVTKWHGFRQVGNSVPPLLAQAVARQIMSAGEYTFVENPTRGQTGDAVLLQFDMSEAAEHFGVSRQVIPPRKRLEKAHA